MNMSRSRYKTRNEKNAWVDEHLCMTMKHSFHRVPLPDNGKHVGKRGRKATGQSWALIAGLPKETIIQEAAYVFGFAGILTVRHFIFSPDKERHYGESRHEFYQ